MISQKMLAFAATACAVAAAPGCLSSTSATSDGGSTAASGSGSSSGSGSTSGAAEGGGGGPMATPIPPDPNGFVGPSTNSLGIVGAWYGYGDDWGTNGAPPGDCESKGMHMTSQCSSITFPPAAMPGPDGGYVATFPQTTPGSMCLSGTAAQVVGGDYSTIFGIGIGFDFNNMGGNKQPYAASDHKVVGFSFHIAGVPAGAGVRVELPTPDTDPSGDSWSRTITADGDYTMDLNTTATDPNSLKASFSMTAMQPAFDPNKIESIQFHIATNTMAAIMVPDSSRLCVSNLAALVSQ